MAWERVARWAAAVAFLVGLLALMHFVFSDAEGECRERGGTLRPVGKVMYCMDGDRIIR